MTPIVPLADLVAELRAMRSIPCLAAADRLEEMDAALCSLPTKRAKAILGAVISGIDEYGDKAPFHEVRRYLLTADLS